MFAAAAKSISRQFSSKPKVTKVPPESKSIASSDTVILPNAEDSIQTNTHTLFEAIDSVKLTKESRQSNSTPIFIDLSSENESDSGNNGTFDEQEEYSLDSDSSVQSNDNSAFTWAFFNSPATLKIAGLLLLAGGLFTLTAGVILASTVMSVAGTVLASFGAWGLFGQFNQPARKDEDNHEDLESQGQMTPLMV